LNLPISQITDALEVLVGSSYVNDFDFNNRAYRVYVQADQPYRAQPTDLSRYYGRASDGQMIPLSAGRELSEATAPAVIGHFQPVPIDGNHRIQPPRGEFRPGRCR